MTAPSDPDPGARALPVDPDVTSADLPVRRRHPRVRDLVRDRADVVAAIAVGGALGSLGRWAVAELVPHDAGSFAWSTFIVNVTGALLLGLLMAFLVDVLAGTRYVRPLLGVGVLGGWTTFSTYMLDTRAMLADGRVPTALLLYLGGTLVVGLVCVWLGLVAGRGAIAALGRAHRRRHGRDLSDERPEGRG